MGGGTKIPSENMYIEGGIAWEGLWDVILGQPPRWKFSLYTPRIIFSIKHPRFNFLFIFHILPRLTYQLPHIVCRVSGEWLFVGSSISFVCSISLNLFSFSSSFSLFPQYSIHSIFLKIFLFPQLQFLLCPLIFG